MLSQNVDNINCFHSTWKLNPKRHNLMASASSFSASEMRPRSRNHFDVKYFKKLDSFGNVKKKCLSKCLAFSNSCSKQWYRIVESGRDDSQEGVSDDVIKTLKISSILSFLHRVPTFRMLFLCYIFISCYYNYPYFFHTPLNFVCASFEKVHQDLCHISNILLPISLQHDKPIKYFFYKSKYLEQNITTNT